MTRWAVAVTARGEADIGEVILQTHENVGDRQATRYREKIITALSGLSLGVPTSAA